MSEQTQTAAQEAHPVSTNHTKRKGIFKRLGDFVNSLLNVTEELVTDTVPEVGGSVYHSFGMINKTAGTAHLSMAIENHKAIQDLKKECGLSEEEFESIKKLCKL